MSLGTLLLVVLIVLVILALPMWPYSRGWGFFPTWIIGAFLLIVLILVLVEFLG